jgi:hypothetical protein
MILFLTDLPDQSRTLVGAAGERGRTFNKANRVKWAFACIFIVHRLIAF